MEKASPGIISGWITRCNIPYGPVLDLGGYHLHKHIKPLRCLFEDYEYLSLDIKSGTNVDIVADAHKLPFKDESFVMVVSSETLQYVANPFKVVAEAYRILRLGGIVCLASSLRARVGLIGNHWSDPEQDTFRYYAKGMRALLTDAGFTDIIRCEVAKNGSCWGVARK